MSVEDAVQMALTRVEEVYRPLERAAYVEALEILMDRLETLQDAVRLEILAVQRMKDDGGPH